MSEPTFHILSPDGIAAEGVELLASHPRFTINAEKLRGDDLMKAIAEADGLIVRSATKVTPDLLAQAPKLKVVARAGVGVDNIDKVASTRAGVLVMNTPDGNTVSAAEQTLTLLLASSRHTAAADRHVRDGRWERKKFLGTEVRGKTLGVLGLGKIGRRVAQYGLALEMNVIANDPVISPDLAAQLGVELADLDDVFTRSDYITIHVPKTEQTANMINADSIAKMKKGVRIVNCARGGIVDEAALSQALKDGHVASAALDVFSSEPPEKTSPLFDAQNLTLTPHLGASTVEAQESVGVEAARLVRDYLLKGAVRNAINAPGLDPADAEALEPYCELGRRLGSMQAQLLDGGVKRMSVTFAGEVFEERDKTFLIRACLEGFFRHYQSKPVNFVNVDHFAKEHGIELETRTTSDTRGFVNLMTIELESAAGKRSISGAVFGRRRPRVVFVDQYTMDAIPEGHAVLFSNDDRPGMLGKLTSNLGEESVNIANVSLGRDKPSGTALCYLNLDARLSDATAKRLRAMDGVLWLRPLTL